MQSLERQLDARQEEIRRRDILLANLVERVPQPEAPREAPGVPETFEKEPEAGAPARYWRPSDGPSAPRAQLAA